MSILKFIRKKVFPDQSAMGIAYSVVRECINNPVAVFGRLNWTNYSNHRVAKSINIDCNICGRQAGLFYDFPNIEKRREHEIGLLRETLSCRSCGGTMRQRALAHRLLEFLESRSGQEFRSLSEYVRSDVKVRIFDTDCYSAIHRVLLEKDGYVASKFLPEEKYGIELERGIYNINLESIDFEDGRFDVVLTSDVMEHVKHDDVAHAEIARILAYGGVYIFTVPYNPSYGPSRALVAETSSGDLFLEKPHFHGDPLTGGILAYRVYGKELIESLKEKGLEATFQTVQNSRCGIFHGDCFVALKQVGVES